VTDAVSLLWRWELAGHPRDVDAWRTVHDLATRAFPRSSAAFRAMPIALAEVVAGDDRAREARARKIDGLARTGRYPSGLLVPAMSPAFAAFERRDFAASIDALEPVAAELERIGGSRAQLDLVEFTLLRAYVSANRREDARRMLSCRRRSSLPVAGLEGVTDQRYKRELDRRSRGKREPRAGGARRPLGPRFRGGDDKGCITL
jgi:hypothetical protein